MTLLKAQCLYCHDAIVYNPFVGEWQITLLGGVCGPSLDTWKRHVPVLTADPEQMIEAIGDLLGVLDD